MDTHAHHRSEEPLLLDTLIAVALTAGVWIQLYGQRFFVFRGGPGTGRLPFMMRYFEPGPEVYLLAALCFLPLAFRRVAPLVTLGVVTFAAMLFGLVPHPPALTLLGPLTALYTVGTLLDRRRLIIASLAVAIALLFFGLPPFSSPRWPGEFVSVIALVGVAAAIGDTTRNRRAYVAEVERRAEEAELRAEEEAKRRVEEERLRIARELHDITAHSMSVIAVQSGAAAHVIDTDPSAAKRALEDIRRTSREALQELRTVLGGMRERGEEMPLAPAPSLARLDELVRQIDEAGYEVTVETGGDLDDLPQLADTTGYRIVQEALTNVMRHAQRGPVTVQVIAEDDRLSLQVTDSGGATPAAHAEGHGIMGMRERALALGGTFEAGPRPEGGWKVAATLPLGRTTRGDEDE